MKALLYVDWCVARKFIPTYLGVALIVSAVVGFGASSGDSKNDAGVLLVSLSSCLLVMLSLFLLTGIFAADEQNNWEGGRLTALPVTPTQIVRERFVFVAIATVVLAAFSLPSAIGIGAVINLLAGTLTILLPDATVILTLIGVAAAFYVIEAFQIACIFVFGLQKARVVYILPFVLLGLLGATPVRETLLSFGSSFAVFAQGIPLYGMIAAAILGGLALIFLSYVVAQRVYARREF